MQRHVSFVAFCFLASVPVHAQGPDPAFDDFERHLLGPDWSQLGAPGAGIVGMSDLGSPSGSLCVAGWVATSFAADAFCEAERSSDIPASMLTQVFVRRRASDLARYGFHWNGDPGNARWEIKYDGVPTAQTRILARLDGPGPQPGDRLRIEIRGDDPVVIQGFHNGILVVSGTDAAPQRITGAGVAGVVARMAQGTVSTPPTAIFESWNGGSLEEAGVGSSFCAGDGSAAPCPCANSGLARHGCENSFTTGGGFLFASGTASVSADTVTLRAFGLPPGSLALCFQGDAQESAGAGIALGDGLRCVSGAVLRLGSRNALAGAMSFGYGNVSDPAVSVRGQIPPSGGVRHYQVWYRNAASFCTGETFNLTNGLTLAWGG